jgi:signal transduction histidine kinase
MAAFFVHDLKNAASTLNLMLQNLPVHFDNPAFRADALRGISKTAAQIKRLISRLSQLRHELKVELVEADLNEIVSQALAGLEHTPGAMLIKEIQPVPLIRVDSEKLSQVVTNLVLNATEALTGGGHVRVTTARQDGWVVLTVDDNGCGMSDEFINQALFRPFQTTKKTGLGIGMFQSKMIVEAHGGRITVASRLGHGTTFQVFLRASESANTVGETTPRRRANDACAPLSQRAPVTLT